MKKEVSVSVFAVLIVAAAILTVYYLNVGPTGFVVFNQASDISNGTYSNTLYDGSAVVLNSSVNATSGTYTSEVLNANNNSASWNNLTWNGNVSANSSLEFF